jgi:hypothetical protein
MRLARRLRRSAAQPSLPDLVLGLLENIGGVEALVGGKQNLEGAFGFQAEVFMPRQQIAVYAVPTRGAESCWTWARPV